jgi:hypothetical protein
MQLILPADTVAKIDRYRERQRCGRPSCRETPRRREEPLTMLLKMIVEREPEPAKPAEKATEPPEKVFAAEFEAAPDLNDEVNKAYTKRMPSAALRSQYREDFFAFKQMCGDLDLDPLRAMYSGPIVATWLAGLTDTERPLDRVRAAFAAIEHYRWLASRDGFVDAVLSACAYIEAGPPEDDGDDGGGKELHGGKEAPAEPAALPLAAEPPQHEKED